MAIDPPDSEQPFLEGDQLAPYKVERSGLCWWCGDPADSREHKFKRTDLTRMWDDEGLMWGDGERMAKIHSARKSSPVRFAANLCAPCNNRKSQPFDYAYEKFSDYVSAGMDTLWRKRFVDMKEIYGANWSSELMNLVRYFVKHMACRMDHDGYGVPSGVPSFLEGGSPLVNVQMAMFKDPELWELHKLGIRDGIDASGLWLGPAKGRVSPSRKRLTVYSSSYAIGYVGVMYRWDLDTPGVGPFYSSRKVRLYCQSKNPEI